MVGLALWTEDKLYGHLNSGIELIREVPLPAECELNAPVRYVPKQQHLINILTDSGNHMHPTFSVDLAESCVMESVVNNMFLFSNKREEQYKF